MFGGRRGGGRRFGRGLLGGLRGFHLIGVRGYAVGFLCWSVRGWRGGGGGGGIQGRGCVCDRWSVDSRGVRGRGVDGRGLGGRGSLGRLKEREREE